MTRGEQQKSTISYQFIPRIPFKFTSMFPEADRTKKACNNLIDGTIQYQMQVMDLPRLDHDAIQNDSFMYGINSRTHVKDKVTAATGKASSKKK